MDTKESPTANLTYTIGNGKGNYDSSEIKLNITLPTDTYVFSHVHDISQTIGGNHKNAIVIFMKRTTDPGTNLPVYSSSTIPHSFKINTMIRYIAGSGFAPFNPAVTQTLVIIFHETPTTPISIANDVSNFFDNVASIYNVFNTNGGEPYVEDVWFLPRKAGMSLVRRSS